MLKEIYLGSYCIHFVLLYIFKGRLFHLTYFLRNFIFFQLLTKNFIKWQQQGIIARLDQINIYVTSSWCFSIVQVINGIADIYWYDVLTEVEIVVMIHLYVQSLIFSVSITPVCYFRVEVFSWTGSLAFLMASYINEYLQSIKSFDWIQPRIRMFIL